MGLGLDNARLTVAAGNSAPPVQKVKPARTSIAEDAIFIPKPHKRVDFKLSVSGVEDGSSTSGGDTPPPPILGQSADEGGAAARDVNGGNVALKSLGRHGITAEFGKEVYGNKYVEVKMEVNNNPTKDFSQIPTQEEGRQSHHARQVHYTQQYDAYGRPRIGFSREPYDFAATKFMVKTAQIKFEENMARHRDQLAPDQPAPADTAAETAAAPGEAVANSTATQGAVSESATAGKPAKEGMIDPADVKENIVGASKLPQPGMINSDVQEIDLLGEKRLAAPGEPPEGEVTLPGSNAGDVADTSKSVAGPGEVGPQGSAGQASPATGQKKSGPPSAEMLPLTGDKGKAARHYKADKPDEGARPASISLSV